VVDPGAKFTAGTNLLPGEISLFGGEKARVSSPPRRA
jgi:hypothetical protein